MKLLKKFLPHFVIALLLGLAVLCVLHSHNPTLAFLTSGPSMVYDAVLIVSGIALAVFYMYGSN